MDNTKIFLTYCTENEVAVQNFAKDLERVGINFVHDTRQLAERSQLEKEYYTSNAPIYLFITDNFLKSNDCMRDILDFLRNPRLQQRIHPIVMEGTQIVDGRYETMPTKFERVGDVIRYINHWQEGYQALRNKQRTASNAEKNIIDKKIAEVRHISNTVIGELLRELRTANRIDFSRLKADSFKRVFETLGAGGTILHERYKLQPTYVPFVPEPVLVEETIEELVSTIAEESKETHTNGVDTNGSYVDIVDNTSPVIETPVEETLKEPIAKVVETVTNETEETIESPVDDILDTIENAVEDRTEVVENVMEETIMDEEPDVNLNLQNIPGINLLPTENDEKEEVAENGSDEETPISENIEVFDENTVIIDESDSEEVLGEMPTSDETPISTEIENTIEETILEVEQEIEEHFEEEEDEEDIEIEEGYEDLDQENKEEDILDILEEGEEEDEGKEDELIAVKDSENLLDIANAFIENGDYGAAQDAYLALLTEQPKNGAAHYEYAVLLQDHLDNPRLANAHLEKASDLHPNNQDIFMRLAMIAENEADHIQAKRYYERVILLNLDHEQAYYKLGKLLMLHTNNQEFVAASYFQRALTLDDEYGEAHLEYGRLLNQYFKKYKKAEKHYKKAIKHLDDESEAVYELAELYLNPLAKKKKAKKLFQKVVELDARFNTDEHFAKFGLERVVEVIEEVEETEMQLGDGQSTDGGDNEPTKIVFITGATSGIGKATAVLFAEHNYKIIITGRRVERLEELRDYLTTAYNAKVLPLAFDIRDQQKVAEIVDALPKNWREIDVLVNNAGLAKGFAPINEGELWHWETMIDTNLKGLLYITRIIAPLMVERQTGHIINIGSIAGKETYPNGNVYCATKSAVDALTKGMRLDLHKHNIRVTGIHPGHVETEFALVRFDGNETKANIYADFQPLKAMDVADTIYYVATRPPHVNIEDIVMWGTQQASATVIDKSGRDRFVLNEKE